MKKMHKFFKYFCLFAYIFCVIVLMVEAGMSGSASSNQSNSIGGTIANIFNDLNGDQTVAVEPNSIDINNKIDSAYVGDKYKIEISTFPNNSTYKEVSYSSSNTDIACVSKDGVISFAKEGIVDISVKNTKFPSLIDSMRVNVKNVVATNIESYIDAKYDEDGFYTLYLGKTYKLNTKFYPSNTTYKSISYFLDRNDYIEINEDGEITTLSYSNNEFTEISVIHENIVNVIKVKVVYENVIPIESISLKDFELYVSESRTIVPIFMPFNATFKEFELISSDKNVLSVSRTTVKGLNAGNVKLELVSKDNSNVKTSCVVIVKEQPKLLNFDASLSDKITLGSSKFISIFNVNPKYASTSNLIFKSSDINIATVDENGKVYANAVGSCFIDVILDNFTKRLNVEIVDKIDFKTTDFELKVNEKYNNGINVFADKNYNIINDSDSIIENVIWNPSNPEYLNFEYELSDESYGIINGNKITFIKPGNVNLIVSHLPSGISKSININIIYEFTVNNLDGNIINRIDVNVNDYAYFSINDNQNNKDIIQSYNVTISNNSISALDCDNGIYNILGLSEGNTIIKVVPLIDNVIYSLFEKEIILNSNHIYSTGLSLFLNDNNTKKEILNDQIIMSLIDDFSIGVDYENNPTTSLIKYSSDNENILKIDKNGKLIPIKSGYVNVTISDAKSSISKTLNIKINNYISLNSSNPFTVKGNDLIIDKSSNTYSITNGFSGSLKLNFDKKSTYTIVKYNSSDKSIATIGDDGTITPYKVGKTLISAEVNDGVLEPIIVRFNLEVKRQDFIKDLDSFFRFIRKSIGHYGAFLVLGIFSTFTWLLFLNKKKMIFSIPINYISGFLIAGITEIIQAFAPGRGPLFKDVLLDYYGFLTSSILITIVIIVLEIYNFIGGKKKRK